MGESQSSDREVFDELMGSHFDPKQFEVEPNLGVGDFEHGLESIFKKMSRRPGRFRRAAVWATGIAFLTAGGLHVLSDSKKEEPDFGQSSDEVPALASSELPEASELNSQNDFLGNKSFRDQSQIDDANSEPFNPPVFSPDITELEDGGSGGGSF